MYCIFSWLFNSAYKVQLLPHDAYSISLLYMFQFHSPIHFPRVCCICSYGLNPVTNSAITCPRKAIMANLPFSNSLLSDRSFAPLLRTPKYPVPFRGEEERQIRKKRVVIDTPHIVPSFNLHNLPALHSLQFAQTLYFLDNL